MSCRAGERGGTRVKKRENIEKSRRRSMLSSLSRRRRREKRMRAPFFSPPPDSATSFSPASTWPFDASLALVERGGLKKRGTRLERREKRSSPSAAHPRKTVLVVVFLSTRPPPFFFRAARPATTPTPRPSSTPNWLCTASTREYLTLRGRQTSGSCTGCRSRRRSRGMTVRKKKKRERVE